MDPYDDPDEGTELMSAVETEDFEWVRRVLASEPESVNQCNSVSGAAAAAQRLGIRSSGRFLSAAAKMPERAGRSRLVCGGWATLGPAGADRRCAERRLR